MENLIEKLKFEPLSIKILEKDYKISKTSREEIDLLLNISWEKTSEEFITEVKKQGTPKKIKEAIYNLEKYKEKLSDSKSEKTVYPLIIAPFLSEDTLKLLIERQISGIDLSGNGAVIVPGKLFFYKTGEKNKFPASSPIKNVFSGVSSTVARVFLLKPEYESVGEVVDEVNRRGSSASFSTVSKVLKSLEEDLIISRNQEVSLIDGKRLLNSLTKNYSPPQIGSHVVGKVSDVPETLKQIRQTAKKEEFRYARNEPSKYTVMPSAGGAIAKIYTDSIKKLADEIQITETDRFPNIELIETEEPTVYFDLREDEGFYWTSPLEVYLELANGGKREKETAGNMVGEILNFSYDK
jgi:Fe2+ or Zn2+ uptake regulation protein